MVRLMLTLAPISCVLAAVGMSELLRVFSANIKLHNQRAQPLPAAPADEPPQHQERVRAVPPRPVPAMPAQASMVVLAAAAALLVFFSMHATFVASEAYSSPSIVLGAPVRACARPPAAQR